MVFSIMWRVLISFHLIPITGDVKLRLQVGFSVQYKVFYLSPWVLYASYLFSDHMKIGARSI